MQRSVKASRAPTKKKAKKAAKRTLQAEDLVYFLKATGPIVAFILSTVLGLAGWQYRGEERDKISAQNEINVGTIQAMASALQEFCQ